MRLLGFIFVGSYGPQHEGHGDGVVTIGFDAASGTLTGPLHAALTDSPSYLVSGADGRTLYAIHECDAGRVTALRADPDGSLATLGTVATGGHHPCHVLARAADLIVCDYRDGVVTRVPIAVDGGLSGARVVLDLARRGTEPHLHCAVPVAGRDRVAITCLGLDELLTCEIPAGNQAARVIASSPAPPGAGPRTLAYARCGAAFVANELDSTVSRYHYDPGTGHFAHVRAVPSTSSGAVNYPAHLTLSADERFAYVSNRGADTIATLAIDDGRLDLIAETPAHAWPQHFELAGNWLITAGQHGDRVTVQEIDPRSGIPRPAAGEVEVGSPSCVLVAM